MMSFYIGVDLGQKHDYTAIAILEKENADRINHTRHWMCLPLLPPKLLLRRLERIPLGTPYPRIVDRIRSITDELPLFGRCALAVDGTGIGAPVVDMLLDSRLACDLTAVTITAGDHASRRSWPWVSVPRRDLLAGVQLALENGSLRIAPTIPEAAALRQELIAMRSDRDSLHHDDLVLALSLACWRSHRKSIYPGGRLPGL